MHSTDLTSSGWFSPISVTAACESSMFWQYLYTTYRTERWLWNGLAVGSCELSAKVEEGLRYEVGPGPTLPQLRQKTLVVQGLDLFDVAENLLGLRGDLASGHFLLIAGDDRGQVRHVGLFRGDQLGNYFLSPAATISTFSKTAPWKTRQIKKDLLTQLNPAKGYFQAQHHHHPPPQSIGHRPRKAICKLFKD